MHLSPPAEPKPILKQRAPLRWVTVALARSKAAITLAAHGSNEGKQPCSLTGMAEARKWPLKYQGVEAERPKACVVVPPTIKTKERKPTPNLSFNLNEKAEEQFKQHQEPQ